MIATLVLLAAIAVASIVGTIVTTARDGYRSSPTETRPSGPERVSAADQHGLLSRLA